MAKMTFVEIIDDLDGAKGASEVLFSFQGVDYSIDLSRKNLAAFEKTMKPYIEAATKIPKTRRTGTVRRSSAPAQDLAAVRAWAKEAGIEVSERGRIPKQVMEQYLRR